MPEPESYLVSLKEFPVEEATTTLWVFKKSVDEHGAPIFTGRWSDLGADLVAEIKGSARSEIDAIEEVKDYTILSQNNEGSALTIDVLDTHADQMLAKAAKEEPNRKITKTEHLNNADFYLIKFTYERQKLYRLNKTDSSWRTKNKKNAISFLFDNYELVLNDKPNFSMSRQADFFIIGERIFIKQKPAFESVLSYKTGHKDAFVSLQNEKEFGAAFVSLDELIAFVGDNKIQLRRAVAIQEKGYYRNKEFMFNLRSRHKEASLNIVFDNDGKIIPTKETVRDIFQALLDFRLTSLFSQNIYDVPDAANVKG